MSDTPRMDRAANESIAAVYEQGCQLERELAEVTKQRDELVNACKQLMKVIGSPDDPPGEWWATDDEINDAYEAGEKALKYLTNKQP